MHSPVSNERRSSATIQSISKATIRLIGNCFFTRSFLQGFHSSICVNMHNFYQNFISLDERQRIDSLEPFDEIEEWQSKCAHYILLFGLKTNPLISNEFVEKFRRDFRTVTFHRKDEIHENLSVKSADGQIKLESYPTTMNYAQRFGHQSFLVDGKFLWTIGGFGTVDGRHRRLKTIEILNIDNGEIQRLDNHELSRIESILQESRDSRSFFSFFSSSRWIRFSHVSRKSTSNFGPFWS